MYTQYLTSDILSVWKQKALHWAEGFDTYCLLNNNSELYPSESVSWELAVNAKRILKCDYPNAFEQLKKFNEVKQNTIYGFLAYDLKNDVEDLSSEKPDYKNFPELYFFEAEHIIRINENLLSIQSKNAEDIYQDILNTKPDTSLYLLSNNPEVRALCNQEEYINTLLKLKEHIIEGDIYEINYCIEFCVDDLVLNPANAYIQLNELSPMPFSSLLKLEDSYILCASPERFLKKEKDKLLSQPIKGTIKRSENVEEDMELKNQLRTTIKELAENVMIVDLVRNDLTKYAKTGSIHVDELFGIYTYPNLHQMISTISAELYDADLGIDALKNAFPMGSMTGAPKIKAMQLIEKYEKSKRGIYSGSIGYITMQNDFDFNVIIRSIFYNHATHKLSFQVGSAITYDSNPQEEYQECLLKAKAILNFIHPTIS